MWEHMKRFLGQKSDVYSAFAPLLRFFGGYLNYFWDSVQESVTFKLLMVKDKLIVVDKNTFDLSNV